MARVAKNQAEDLEAVKTAQEAAKEAPDAAGGTDTTTAEGSPGRAPGGGSGKAGVRGAAASPWAAENQQNF